METTTVNEQGMQFAYLDSGPVQGNSYTTVIIVHGHSYHAQNFKKLFPLAPKYNLRIVALNRKGYVGSTLFSQEELAQLDSGNVEEHRAFFKDRGLELARFMAWFIREHEIPKASEDGLSGGVALLGWSAGTITTISTLSYLDSYPSEIVTSLDPYLRTKILYDPPQAMLGYPILNGYFPPTNGEDANRLFGDWISAYYSHPDIKSRTLTGLQMTTPLSPRRLSTNDTIAPEELLTMIDLEAPRSDEKVYVNVKPETLHEQTCRAFFDADLTSRFLPKLKVTSISCNESVWCSLWCAWELEKEVKQMRDGNMEGRKVSFISLDSANHFLHWDDPDRALTVFASIICTAPTADL